VIYRQPAALARRALVEESGMRERRGLRAGHARRWRASRTPAAA